MQQHDNPELRSQVAHPEFDELFYLCSVMVVDEECDNCSPQTKGPGTGLCFFADQQIDRSPPGSCVAARVAIASIKGLLELGESWTYHSVVSNVYTDEEGFVGELDRFIDARGRGRSVIVWTYGRGWYTVMSTFIREDGDQIGNQGFSIKNELAGG